MFIQAAQSLYKINTSTFREIKMSLSSENVTVTRKHLWI
ncbi:hypothetical protein AVDCRST_MAG92-2415 [uncultured Coleofasciculus sp.]|uniref:Uncharacterized protein n=1 Tax=uncultured Coleofasciculus sp. TaxID=1267456 RepID=A0A6J4IUF0_9CYAN|nr:hypothetical protein AVDCRST_MAG92-2415 [uncultured Coleofasciculus sp.]